MASPTISAANRRCTNRRQPRPSLKVFCRRGSTGLGPNIAVAILDLSETGVRLTAKAELNKGQEIEIELTFPGQNGTIKRLADVVWCVAAADEGIYCLGARFQKRLAYGEFVALSRPR